VLWSIGASLLVSTPLSAGLWYAAVCARRGKPADAAQFLRGFQRLPRMLFLAVLFFCIALAVVLPAVVLVLPVVFVQRSSGGGPIFIVWYVLVALLAVFGLVYMMSRFYFAYVLGVDEGVGDVPAVDALKMSWEWTRGKFWPLLGASLVLLLVVLACVAACVLPYFFLAGPWTMAVMAIMYCQLGRDAGAFGVLDVCPACGYSLHGLKTPTCPECGTPVPEEWLKDLKDGGTPA
jgi:hypothetical protein